ncbi:hypothetical protein LBMAG53_22250 [Planctomycetota bacterium]|nr:hypothetical protein LBMAG53_22250 [Planctomycetota bacterium]
MPAQPNRSLAHGLEVLHALAMSGPDGRGSRELARLIGMEPTRANRLLGTLADLGLAERTPDRRYRPGPGIHVLAAASLGSSGLLRAALPDLEILLGEGLPCALGVAWRDQVCYLFFGMPGRPVAEGIANHRLFPASQSSIGAVLASQAKRWRFVAGPGDGQGSLAVPVGIPPIAGLAVLCSRSADHSALAERLRTAADRIAARLIAPSAGQPDAADRPSPDTAAGQAPATATLRPTGRGRSSAG